MAALALMVTGMLAPYHLRRLDGRGPAGLFVAAYLAAPTLVWIGLAAVTIDAADAAHRLAAFWDLVPIASGTRAPIRAYAMTVLLLAMLARSVITCWRTSLCAAAAHRALHAAAHHREDDVLFAPTGTVACTAGILRPRVIVDPGRFGRLTAPQRGAVLAHERAHARGRHGLIDLLMRGLTCGLRPLPGVALAHGELRRHLEALADERAARTVGRRVVASAIVDAAAPPPVHGLGAGGWAAWRVDRLLAPPVRPGIGLVPLVAIVLVALGALLQTVAHLGTGAHLLPVAFPVL